MSLPIPHNTKYGIWMRASSSSGGKDWLGFVTDASVISQWGKTGMVRQSKALCDRPSFPDLDRKVMEKLTKGYRVLGEYHAGRGWTHLPSSTANLKTPEPSPDPAKGEVAAWLSASDTQEWF